LSRENNFTTGKVYLQVIENEREGKYLGKTVQVVPHITDEIKRRIHLASANCDLLIGEIGGTVGEYQNMLFLEAARMMKIKQQKAESYGNKAMKQPKAQPMNEQQANQAIKKASGNSSLNMDDLANMSDAQLEELARKAAKTQK
jgi:CTP synthase (UTP-ammonia lyase)